MGDHIDAAIRLLQNVPTDETRDPEMRMTSQPSPFSSNSRRRRMASRGAGPKNRFGPAGTGASPRSSHGNGHATSPDVPSAVAFPNLRPRLSGMDRQPPPAGRHHRRDG